MNSNVLKTIELLEGLRNNSEFTKYNAKNFEFNLDPDQSYEIYFQHIKKKYSVYNFVNVCCSKKETCVLLICTGSIKLRERCY